MKYLFVLLPLVAASTLFANPPWSANVRACDVGDTINEGESCIASDGNYIYCICNVNERSQLAVIPYGRSTDAGATWTTTWWNDPTAPSAWHTDPVIITDDTGYVHMFIQYSTIVIRQYLSFDHGATWSETTQVSDIGATVDKPWFCHYGNNIYGAWQEFGGAVDGIRFARSTDGGRNWTITVADSNNTGIAGITCSPSGYIYLMNRNWGGSSVLCRRSTDEGATWSPWVTITDECTYSSGWGDRAPLPSIAAPADNDVFITWVDDRYGNWDVLCARSTDGGSTWSSIIQLPDSSAGGQCKGWVIADPYGNLHAMWYHTPSWPTSNTSRWSVRYRHSEDRGATWSPSTRLNDTTFTTQVTFMGEYHVMVADSQHVRAVWTDGRGGDNDLYFAEADLSLIGVEENPFRVRRPADVSLSVPAIARNPTPVTLSLRRSARVGIEVFDASGRRLSRLDLGPLVSGTHTATLEGLPAGRPLFVRATTGLSQATAKLTVIQ